MYYYAFLNENDIVVSIYEFPTTISHPQYIQIASNDQTLIGKHYNRSTTEFEDVYYYAVINDKNICVSVTFAYEEIVDPSYIAVTSYDESLIGLYWNGAAFVTAPISVLAVASTDTVNYKQQDKWLSTKLDEMDEAITGKAATVHGHVVSDITGLSDSLDAIDEEITSLAATVAGKANASHTHTAADVSGVVKTINNTAPDENGNITIAVSGGMTAEEILDAVKTVDGAGSGLDADKLDGLEATAFAAANHTHSQYLTADDIDDFVTSADVTEAISGKANSVHTHAMGDVTGLADALAGKSNTNHTHTGYATTASVTALETAIDGKADVNHTHSGYATTASVTALTNTVDGKADVQHTHSQNDVVGLANALSGKANTSHTHAQSEITGLTAALAGKSDTSHTHSDYLSTSGGTVSGNLAVNGVVRVQGQQCIFNSGSMVTLATNNLPTMIAGSQIYSKTEITVSSDERLKEGIGELDENELLEFIKKLIVVEYNYIGEESKTKRIGVIAQDVVKANPEIAKYFVNEDNDGYLGVKTADLVYPLIAAVQKLAMEIEALKK